MATTTLRRRAAPASGPFRTPLPLLMGGIIVALLLILLVALPQRAPAVDPGQLTTYSEQEALVFASQQVRSGDVARQMVATGKAKFEEGAWLINVGDAQFHFSARNRILVPDNESARTLQFRDPGR